MPASSPAQPSDLTDQIRYLLGQLAAIGDARGGRPHACLAFAPPWYQVGYDRAWGEETQKRHSLSMRLS